MKVVVFENTWDREHCRVQRAFAEGIPDAIVRPVEAYEPCDVAVIFGLVKKSYAKTYAKKAILEKHRGRSLIVMDAALVRRGDYWQVGFGGIAGDADFRAEGAAIERFHGFGVPVGPWSWTDDGPVVLLGQLPRDVQVQHTAHVRWIAETAAEIERRGYRLIFRPHPKVADPAVYGVRPEIHHRGPLADALKGARCAVAWNSTALTEAAIAGVPVVAMEKSCFAWPVAGHGLEAMARPPMPGRAAWLAKLGVAQWTEAELRSGATARHLFRP